MVNDYSYANLYFILLEPLSDLIEKYQRSFPKWWMIIPTLIFILFYLNRYPLGNCN